MVKARIAVGGFLHESHSFAPRPTTYADFLQPGGLPPFSAGADLIDAIAAPVGAAGRRDRGGRGGRRGPGAAGLGFRQPRRAGAGRGVRAHRRADLRAAVGGAGCGTAGRRLSRPAWRGGGGEFPGCRGRVAAPGARDHRRRSAADHQPGPACQPDRTDGAAGGCGGAVPDLSACRHEGRRRAGDAAAAGADRARRSPGRGHSGRWISGSRWAASAR